MNPTLSTYMLAFGVLFGGLLALFLLTKGMMAAERHVSAAAGRLVTRMWRAVVSTLPFVLRGVAYLAPPLAIASFIYFSVNADPWYVAIAAASAGFFGFGFAGLFAWGLARRLDERR